MRKITVSRPQRIHFPFTKGKILIDGSEHGLIKGGQTVTIEVADGYHDLQVTFASMPPTHSNVVQIEPTDGDLSFEVRIVVTPGRLQSDGEDIIGSSTPTYAELKRK